MLLWGEVGDVVCLDVSDGAGQVSSSAEGAIHYQQFGCRAGLGAFGSGDLGAAHAFLNRKSKALRSGGAGHTSGVNSNFRINVDRDG
jgi:hypothetical protein